MKDVSVEYAHIYTNNHIDEEHEKSLEILSSLRTELSDKSISLVVMIDDYSFPDPTFDYVEFGKWLSTQGSEPSFMLRESQLIPICDEVLSMLPEGKLKHSIKDYIKAKKYPCSLFISAWYMLRLGYTKSPLFPEQELAHQLINILPESFRPFEDKAIEIMNAIDGTISQKIEYRFFEGRLVA